jgi:hypothetical protein
MRPCPQQCLFLHVIEIFVFLECDCSVSSICTLAWGQTWVCLSSLKQHYTVPPSRTYLCFSASCSETVFSVVKNQLLHFLLLVPIPFPVRKPVLFQSHTKKRVDLYIPVFVLNGALFKGRTCEIAGGSVDFFSIPNTCIEVSFFLLSLLTFISL